MVQDAAKEYNISQVVLLAMLKAESGLNPNAIRRGVWPDISSGFSQICVATAGGYGIGDGSDSQENIESTLAALCDRATAIDLGARHLSMCLDSVNEQMPGLSQDEWELQGLLTYNSGGTQPRGNWYWSRYADNVSNYLGCLAWARGIVGGK
jgi:soluble lytic murein transglycosylase-like protein